MKGRKVFIQHDKVLNGRGALINPAGRFDKIVLQPDPDAEKIPDEEQVSALPPTECFLDTTQTLINYNDSPDVGFSGGINAYRGCEHGCIYCFARPSHEYFQLSSGIDFETKIFVKTHAPQLLRKELSRKNYQPQVLAMSGNTDSYQPLERRFKITRQCLEVLLEFRNPVAIITKNRLVERDIDVLQSLSQFNAASVFISLTTLDERLAGLMEPRASRPGDRLHAIAALRRAGIPVGVLTAPVIPGLTDHELPSLLKAASEAGAQFAGYVVLRLPYAVKDLFVRWLEEYFPERRDKVIGIIKDLRDGKLNDSTWGQRMTGQGVWAEHLHNLFTVYAKRYGLSEHGPALSTASFRRIEAGQMTLFE